MSNKFFNIFCDNDTPTDLSQTSNFEQFAKLGLIPEGGLNAPLYVMWELTSSCPNKCVYCYNNSHMKTSEISSKNKFEIADELIDAGIFQICLTGGEPTSCPEYFDLIKYFRTKGVEVGTVLSGANLTRAKVRNLSQYIKMVQISLDGSTPEIHDLVRQRKGSFDEAVNAIKYFKECGRDVKVSFAITKHNIDDFENTYNLCEKLGVSSLRTQRLAVSGRAKTNEKSIYATDEQLQKFEAFIARKTSEKPKMTIEYRSPYEHIEFGIKNGYAIVARITSKGDVGVTPYIDAYFGNIKNESFKDIWQKMRLGWHNSEMLELANSVISRGNGILTDPLEEAKFIGR